MGLFGKIFGRPGSPPLPRRTRRERELDADIERQLQSPQRDLLDLAQTVVLLALSRGERAPMSPTVRRALLGRQLIVPIALVPDLYEITDAGREVLAASPFLVRAQRQSDSKWARSGSEILEGILRSRRASPATPAIGDEVRWETSEGEGSGTVVKIVRRRGLGAETTITVLDAGDGSLLRYFTERPEQPAGLRRTGSWVALESARARHRREVAAALGVSVRDRRVSDLGWDWGEHTEPS